jgi:hypothetical protein
MTLRSPHKIPDSTCVEVEIILVAESITDLGTYTCGFWHFLLPEMLGYRTSYPLLQNACAVYR